MHGCLHDPFFNLWTASTPGISPATPAAILNPLSSSSQQTGSSAMHASSCSPQLATPAGRDKAERVEGSTEQQVPAVTAAADAGATPIPNPDKAAEPSPPTWRKRKSQKGKFRFKVLKDGTTPRKTAATPAKRKAEDSHRPVTRRKLVFDGEPPPPPESTSFCFSKASLMDNLRQIMKSCNLSDDGNYKKRSKNKKRRTRRVDKLILVPYNNTRDTNTTDVSTSPLALVVHGGSASSVKAYVPRWSSEELAVVPYARVPRLVMGVDEGTVQVYDELMKREEIGRGGEGVEDVPGGPEWEGRRREFELRVHDFMDKVRAIVGNREFSPWGGSVVMSVVGTFLTQNVTDNLSSNAFMNIAATFSSQKNDSKDNLNLNETSGDAESNLTEPSNAGFDEEGSCHDKDLDEFINSLRKQDLSDWDDDRVKKLLNDKFGNSTAAKIIKELNVFLKPEKSEDTSHWNALMEEAYQRGYKNDNVMDTIDWEAFLNAPFAEISRCIRDRGQHCLLAFRILTFLMRIKKDHGNIDLEWLRHIPPASAKKYLLSISGLGEKSVDCIRLLSLRHIAFPVDTNVARIVTRLGWVQLQSMPLSQEFHMVEKYPIMADIQRYLWPRLCTIDGEILYELHCQIITFGKVICMKHRPNCGACPFVADCKAVLAPEENGQQDATEKINMDKLKDLLFVRSTQQLHQLEGCKNVERLRSDPIIEIPPTPLYEYPKSPSEEEYEQECHLGQDIEDILPHYDDEINLCSEKYTVDIGQSRLGEGRCLVPINPQTYSTQMQKKYPLRTEYYAYVLPDSHDILQKFEKRVSGDPNPYLLIIRNVDEHTVMATFLIPCRTANRGCFPLNGTYFQENEVFADDSSSRCPVTIYREHIWNLERRIVYFGSTIHSIAKAQTYQGIRQCFKEGHICTRGFDRETRRPKPLFAQIHATNINKENSKKRPSNGVLLGEDNNVSNGGK